MGEAALKQIEEFKSFAAAGDIAGMAKHIELLHENWDVLEAGEQEEIQKLEAIFLSLVNLKTEEA